ncbi:hypothetical protein ABIA25_004801 [Sinorhizobium fredii]
MFRVALLAATLLVPSIANAQALQQQPPLEQKLVDGFEGNDFAPEGGLYYRENFEQSAGTVEFQSGVKRTGNGGLKLSVVPHCPTLDDGCSERAEIWGKDGPARPLRSGRLVWLRRQVRGPHSER